jgi:hypothetical protein
MLRAIWLLSLSLHAQDQRKLVLHLIHHPIGEENYEMARDGEALAMHISYETADRGNKRSLTADLPDGSVAVEHASATVREGESERKIPLGRQYFVGKPVRMALRDFTIWPQEPLHK